MAPSPVPDQNAMPETKSLTPATLQINILSFGHKHEPPGKTDLLFDVRFLPNPYYVPELKEKTGLDEAVATHALHHENGRQFLVHLFALLDFLLRNLPAAAETTSPSRWAAPVGNTVPWQGPRRFTGIWPRENGRCRWFTGI